MKEVTTQMPRKISQYLEKRNIPPKQTQEAFLQPEEEEKTEQVCSMLTKTLAEEEKYRQKFSTLF